MTVDSIYLSCFVFFFLIYYIFSKNQLEKYLEARDVFSPKKWFRIKDGVYAVMILHPSKDYRALPRTYMNLAVWFYFIIKLIRSYFLNFRNYLELKERIEVLTFVSPTTTATFRNYSGKAADGGSWRISKGEYRGRSWSRNVITGFPRDPSGCC